MRGGFRSGSSNVCGSRDRHAGWHPFWRRRVGEPAPTRDGRSQVRNQPTSAAVRTPVCWSSDGLSMAASPTIYSSHFPACSAPESWGEDPDLTPPRPPAYADDATDLCHVKGPAIALLILAGASEPPHLQRLERAAGPVRRSGGGDQRRCSGRRTASSRRVGTPSRRTDNYLDTGPATRNRLQPEYGIERAVPGYVNWPRRHDR